jgi:hypothetical protein
MGIPGWHPLLPPASPARPPARAHCSAGFKTSLASFLNCSCIAVLFWGSGDCHPVSIPSRYLYAYSNIESGICVTEAEESGQREGKGCNGLVTVQTQESARTRLCSHCKPATSPCRANKFSRRPTCLHESTVQVAWRPTGSTQRFASRTGAGVRGHPPPS